MEKHPHSFLFSFQYIVEVNYNCFDFSSDFTVMSWNTPNSARFTIQCNGREARIMNCAWSGNCENRIPSSFKGHKGNQRKLTVSMAVSEGVFPRLAQTACIFF